MPPGVLAVLNEGRKCPILSPECYSVSELGLTSRQGFSLLIADVD